MEDISAVLYYLELINLFNVMKTVNCDTEIVVHQDHAAIGECCT